MSSEIKSDPAFFADFRSNTPDLNALITEIRRIVCSRYLQADMFTYGGKTLVIAYPQPPRMLDRPKHTVRLQR